MINIYHKYTANVIIIFDHDFRMPLFGSLDDITDRICDKMMKHNFNRADVIENGTGKILMVVVRS